MAYRGSHQQIVFRFVGGFLAGLVKTQKMFHPRKQPKPKIVVLQKPNRQVSMSQAKITIRSAELCQNIADIKELSWIQQFTNVLS